MVKINPNLHITLRILLVSLLVACLGLGASSYQANRTFSNGMLAVKSENWLAASTYLKSAAQYYPWRTELLISAGRYAFLGGDPKTTIQYLGQPQIQGQLSSDNLLMLGEAYLQTGNLDQARQTWQQVTEHEDSLQALKYLADLSQQQEDYSAAIGYFLSMVRLVPSDAKLQYEVGLLYAATEPLKALPYLATAAEIDPALATIARELHDEIRTANLFDQPAYLLVASGRQLGSLGEWQLAEEAFKHATQADPEYPDARAFLGEARQQVSIAGSKAISDAGYSDLALALEIDPGSVVANTLMSLFWERQRDFTQAQSYLERAISIDPDDPYLFTELGNILSKAGDLPAAQANFEKAISLAPDKPLFYRLLAEFAMENHIQVRELALPAGRQAVKLDPQDPDSLDVMARIMLELEDYHAAEQYARKAIDTVPGYAPGYLHLGMAYIFLDQPDLAREWLERAKAADPSSWVASQASRMLDYYFP